MKNLKSLSKSKIKEIQQNLIELQESPFRLKKYYDYDGTKYRGIRGKGNFILQNCNQWN